MISYPVGIGKTMKIDHNGVRMFASGLSETIPNEIRGYSLLNNESNLENLENLVSRTVPNLSNDQCISTIPVTSSVQSNTSIDASHNIAGHQNIDTRNESRVIQKYTNILSNESSINVGANSINPQTPESGFYDETTNATQIQRCTTTAQQLQNQQQYKLVYF